MTKTVIIYELAEGRTTLLALDGDYSHLDMVFLDIDDPRLEGKELELHDLKITEKLAIEKGVTSEQAVKLIRNGATLIQCGEYN